MGRLKDWTINSLILIAFAWGMFSLLKVYEVRSKQPRSQPVLADTQWAVGVTLGLFLAQLLFRYVFAVVARVLVVKKQRWSYTVWNVKVARCCDAFFKMFYYMASTGWLFALLRHEPWTPPVLGGRGDTTYCWRDFTTQSVNDDLRRFYLMAIGFNCSEMLLLLYEARHPDFSEMLLHHIVSCFLTLYSYLLGYTRIGSLVLLLHGVVDIFIFASKAFVDTPHIRVIAVLYLALVLSYFYFRIYIFPVYIMRSAWVESVDVTGNFPYAWGFANFCLVVLLLLHMYWFGLIGRMGLTFRRTGEARDLQANLSQVSLDGNAKKKD